MSKIADLVPTPVAAAMEAHKRMAKAWVPHPYQERALKFMLENAQSGLFLDPGLGKTSISLAALKILLKRKLIRRALVVAPLRAIYDVWPMEISDWKNFNNFGVAILHDAAKDKVLRSLQPEHQIVLINPEGFSWLTAKKANLKSLGADTLVVDECFSADTLVTVPDGRVKIALLKVGDTVYNELGACKVAKVTSRKPKGGMVEVCLGKQQKAIQCTEDHPFFTDIGWLPAKCLKGRKILSLAALRDMRKDNNSRCEQVGKRFGKDLLFILREEMGSSQSRLAVRREFAEEAGFRSLEESVVSQYTTDSRRSTKSSDSRWRTDKNFETRSSACISVLRNMWKTTRFTTKETAGRFRHYLLTKVWYKTELEERFVKERQCAPQEGSRSGYKNIYGCACMEQRHAMAGGFQKQSVEVGLESRAYMEPAWRERARAFQGRVFGTEMLAKDIYFQLSSRVGWKAAWLSYQLQSRLWKSSEEDSLRSRRNEPRAAKGSGFEEGNEVAGAWVEAVSYLKPGSIPLVYNLEVEGCPHFEVEGCAVVHNSSRWKDGTTVRFRALRPHLAEFKRRYILTGSPRPRNYLDLFGQLFILDRGAALGAYISHYRNQFFFPTGYKGYDWQILPGAAEKINALVAPMVLRLDAKDYLKLPKVLEREHHVVLPPKVRGEYDSIESSLMSTLFTAPLTSSASARSKCAQIANGGLYMDAGPQDERWPSKQRPVKFLHTAKVEALVDLYNELQGEPVLVSIGFHHDVEAIRNALGKDIPCINGETTRSQASDYIERWNKGLLPMLMVHPASAGHALNLQKFNARHVAFFFIPDDYDHFDQCFRRVWRQGNKADFVMRHLFVTENTVDVAKVRNLRRKGAGQQSFLDAMRAYAAERGYKVSTR